VTVPILFGPGFAVLLTGLHCLQYFTKVWSLWPYGGMCSLDARSIDPGCNHGGDRA